MKRFQSNLGSVSLALTISAVLLASAVAKETVVTDAPGQLTGLRIDYRTPKDKEPASAITLRGADARQQLLITANFDSGAQRDYTRLVTFTVNPAEVAKVDRFGVIMPLKDGAATLTAASKEGVSATLNVTVETFGDKLPINFPNQIVPLFTKAGCNAGGCHGKSSGQNGFKLSLLGFEPTEDYEHLVKESHARRIFVAAPERSLLLQKGAALVPHGGGKRMEVDSDDYRLLVRWVSEGMPYGKATDRTITSIDVFPSERTMPLGGEQQLIVTAHYSDGSAEDVTRSALFEANNKEMAKADVRGHVTFFDQPGDVAVMVRYQARVAVFRATLPLGAPVAGLPKPKNFIDELVFKKLLTVGMPPSPICDDATFVRRTSIDITGRLPTPEETQKFMAEKNPAKRDQWIEYLLNSPGYADYFANKWSALLRNKRAQPTFARGNYEFHAWIRDSFMANKPFDQFVREVIAASGETTQNPPVVWYRQVSTPNAQLEDTAQLFLGLRLQCAQCHHHPYEKWSQFDYYSFSAFFSQVGRKRGEQSGEEIIYHRRGLATAVNKKTGQSVKPAGLGAPPADLSPDDDPRQSLVDWITGSENPLFARALVNRYWKHFFNRGLVDPEDDMRETNPATNPQLLDALANHFARSGYDLKNLVRTICQSGVYQLSAIPNQYNAIDKQNFSRYYPKRLTAEVLFDAINGVLKSDSHFDGLEAGTRAVELPDNSYNSTSFFLTVFGRPDSSSSCECERSQDASLAQSLHLLNAKDIQEKISADGGRAAALAGDTTRSEEAKIRELYFWAYSREPEVQEVMLAKGHLEKKIKDKDGKEITINQRQAYEDIVWALINTKEFLFNH